MVDMKIRATNKKSDIVIRIKIVHTRALEKYWPGSASCRRPGLTTDGSHCPEEVAPSSTSHSLAARDSPINHQ